MATVAQLTITRTINGAVMHLSSDGDVELELDVRTFGKYVPARVDAPPEHCYPAEHPDMDLRSATTVGFVSMYDSGGSFRCMLRSGTEVSHELTAAQTVRLLEAAYEEVSA